MLKAGVIDPAKEAAEKVVSFVILSEAKNLSGF
jgi:hypothetical protein